MLHNGTENTQVDHHNLLEVFIRSLRDQLANWACFDRCLLDEVSGAYIYSRCSCLEIVERRPYLASRALDPHVRTKGKAYPRRDKGSTNSLLGLALCNRASISQMRVNCSDDWVKDAAFDDSSIDSSCLDAFASVHLLQMRNLGVDSCGSRRHDHHLHTNDDPLS